MQVDYREDVGTFNEKVARAPNERRVVYMDRSDVDPSMFAAPKIRSSHDSGKGVRIQASIPAVKQLVKSFRRGPTVGCVRCNCEKILPENKIEGEFDVQGGRVYDSKMGVTCHW